MSETAEQEAFRDLLLAIDDVLAGVSEAKQLMGDLPADPAAFAALDLIQRTAARALLKCVEQVQDLLARALRTLLILEQVEVAGLSPRAIADRAETLGILDSSDRWCACAISLSTNIPYPDCNNMPGFRTHGPARKICAPLPSPLPIMPSVA
ncbi:MAG: hypothetical protein ACSLE1_16950 [Sphingobium sp.]